MRRLLPALAVLLPLHAQAMRVPTSRPALCARSELVVIGEITGHEARWQTGESGGIETLWDVSVSRAVRGRAPDSLTLRTPGGSVGGITLTISEAARLRADARYLLLLTPGPDGWELVGGADGAVPLPWQDAGAEAAAVASLGGCRA